jgi:hypothetical protein
MHTTTTPSVLSGWFASRRLAGVRLADLQSCGRLGALARARESDAERGRHAAQRRATEHADRREAHAHEEGGHGGGGCGCPPGPLGASDVRHHGGRAAAAAAAAAGGPLGGQADGSASGAGRAGALRGAAGCGVSRRAVAVSSAAAAAAGRSRSLCAGPGGQQLAVRGSGSGRTRREAQAAEAARKRASKHAHAGCLTALVSARHRSSSSRILDQKSSAIYCICALLVIHRACTFLVEVPPIGKPNSRPRWMTSCSADADVAASRPREAAGPVGWILVHTCEASLNDSAL